MPPATPGRLSVSIDNLNTITAGKIQQFLVQVTNESNSADSDIVVTARLPVGSTADAGTSGPNAGVTAEKLPGAVRFSPVAELRPNDTIDYRVFLTTSKPGPILLRVEVSSRRLTQPVVAEKTVAVLPSE